MLTGKCKEDFEKWYLSKRKKEFSLNYLEMIFSFWLQQQRLASLNAFNCSPFSMQYGVYVDFFDSVGIKIIIGTGFSGYLFNYRLSITGMQDEFDNEIESRNEARIKAIEKANEIYNQK